MNELIYARDKLGRAFKAGDFIAYGHALGRSAGLRIGKVLDIRRVGGLSYGPDYAVPKPVYRIAVVGADDDWDARELTLCKKGTLYYPERCLLLDSVPPSYMKLYNEAGL